MINENDCVEVIQKSLNQLELYQNNMEMFITAFADLVNNKSQARAYTEDEKIKAAYALNLCTVSVSQIIDYDDIQILEQEYEMILNNLNLENMPKDESLLNILKQLLDTITFFRIQEGDKKFIEKEYQQKIRNAIWAAVPNFGLIVAGGSPITMGISLASQIGIGYMNYRKAKAEIELEKERQNWHLQRAALEQLNGLRRELFDTAWRLADEYNFSDKYRLTERQITQYNAILMDSDPVRRYERLDSIKDKFMAYVPFWYHFGNTANQIAQDLHFSIEVRNIYKEYAINHYETFQKLNDKKLLREDQIASACALEYIDLLDSEKDIDKINEMIDAAIKSSGGSCDILELCAIAYLKVKNTNGAKTLLRQLVNEDYNAIINAQLLSNIYVSDYVYRNNPNQAMIDYEILETRVPKEYLFPCVEDGIYDIDKLNENFFDKQLKVLMKKCQLVLYEFIKKYTINYNKVFPVPDVSRIYEDTYFLDGENERGKRFEDLEALFANKRRKEDFFERLKDSTVIDNLFKVLNEMYESVGKCGLVIDYDFLDVVLTGSIVKCKEPIMDLLEDLSDNKTIDNISIDRLEEIGFRDIAYDFFKELHSQFMESVKKCKNMTDLAVTDSALRKFCMEQMISTPDELFNKRNNKTMKALKRKISPKLLGVDYAEIEKSNEVKSKLIEIIKAYKDELIIGDKTTLIISGMPDFDAYFRKKGKEKWNNLKKNMLAIIDAKGALDSDLILTHFGVVIVNFNSLEGVIPYNKVIIVDDCLEGEGYETDGVLEILSGIMNPYIWIGKKLICYKYKNKNVRMSKLNELISELNKEIPPINTSKKKGSYEISYGKDNYDFLEI